MSMVSPRELNRHLVILSRKRRQYMSEQLQSYNLSDPLYALMLYLERHQGCNQDALANHFGFDKGTVARLAKKLESSGYISREVCSHDRRKYSLKLTSQGQLVMAVIHRHLNDWCEFMLNGLDDQDRDAASRLLSVMTDNVQKNSEERLNRS